MRWCFVYHDPQPLSEGWTLPRGFAEALKAEGVQLWSYPFKDPSHVRLPSCDELRQREVTVLLVFYAGRSLELEAELLRIRKETNLIIVNELGDEPQTRQLNAVRVQLSDICLSPDANSSLHWRQLGSHCVWFTHWADTKTFYPIADQKARKPYFVVTTMGRRKYDRILRLILRKKYVNQRCIGLENAVFFSSGKIAFQYARWNEITRRLFESAACGCCILTNQLPEKTRVAEIFPPNFAAIYYTNLFSLLYKLIILALSPDFCKNCASNGQRIVLKSHTESARAKQLVQLLQSIQLNKALSL